jgi:hypothetical protein
MAGAVEARIAGTIHLSHAARTERRLDLRPQHRTRECHLWAGYSVNLTSYNFSLQRFLRHSAVPSRL